MKRCAFLLSTLCSSLLLLLHASPVLADYLTVCRGEVPAQVNVLTNALVEGERVYVQLTPDKNVAGDCTTLAEDIPDTDILWARLINASLLVDDDARIILQGLFEENQISVSEVIVPTPPPPPRPEATPPAQSQSRSPARELVDQRSAWFWAPALWMETPGQLWQLAEGQNIDRLYLTIPVENGEVRFPQQLADFISQSREKGFSIWAVVGDRNDVLPESLPALLARATAYRQYNADNTQAAAIDGLQLDIEPYLLPGFNLNQDYWRQRYIETIHAVHSALGDTLPLDLVMPVWWGNHPRWGNNLFDAMALPGLSITVMNYRTEFERLRAEAIPFFEWGTAQSIPIHMALETGNLVNELRKHYFPDAARGELWYLEVGEYHLLVLMNQVHAALPGKAFRLAFESEFTAQTLTFAGNNGEMNATATRLVTEWMPWPAFSGIAIHGLDQNNTEVSE